MSSSNIEEVRQITTGGIARSAEATPNDWNVKYVGTGVFQNVSTWEMDPPIDELHIFNTGMGRNLHTALIFIHVYSGGVLSTSKLDYKSFVDILDGGSVFNVSLYGEATLTVCGGYASGITEIQGYNRISVSYDGIIINTTLRGGSLIVDAGGYAYNTTMSNTRVDFFADGFASNNLLLSGSYMAMSGGFAYDNRVYSDCVVRMEAGYISATDVYYSGTLSLYYDSIASNTTIHAGGVMVFSGGFANEVTVSQGGVIDLTDPRGGHIKELNLMGTLLMPAFESVGFIYSHGTSPHLELATGYGISGLYISSGGFMRMREGGNIEYTVVSSDGVIHNSGGNTYDTEILSGGLMRVSSGSAFRTIVYNGGLMQVGRATINETIVSGGTVELDHPTAASWYAEIYDGYIVVWSGAQAHNSFIYGGSLFVMNGTSYNTSAYGGEEYVGSAGVASATCIYAGALQNVRSGGSALTTTISAGGMQAVRGYASNTRLYGGAEQYIYDGGIASATSAHGNSIQKVSSGGRSYNASINGGTEQWVALGGSAMDTNVAYGAKQIVSSGGRTYGDILYGEQYLYGGIASGTLVSVGGIQKVSSGGQAYGAIVDRGEQWVRDGGLAVDTTINTNCLQIVYANSIARNTVLEESAASQRVESGGAASNTAIRSGAIQNVLAGGAAYSTVISSGGSCFINSGASLYGFIQRASGLLSVQGYVSGGNTYGDMYLYGATTSAVSVQSGGVMKVSSGSVATNATVLTGGVMWIADGGTAVGTVISSAAGINCYAGGTATNTLVQSQGTLRTYGGTIAGTTELFGYLLVQSNAANTGNIVMNLGSPSTTYQFITGFGKLSGGSYTVKATSSLATGYYALADSTGLNNITLTVNGSDYALSKGGSKTVGNYTYSLVNEQSKSMLRITAASGGASAGLSAIDDGFSEAMNMLAAGDSPSNLFAAQDEFLDLSPGVGVCGSEHTLACADSCNSDTSTALKQALLA